MRGEGMSAIIKIGGKQFTVKEGDVIRVEKMDGELGQTVKIDSVMALIGGEEPKFGSPFVQGASVEARVKRQGRAKKIFVFRYKPKKRIRTKTGHRQHYTELEIDKIITA